MLGGRALSPLPEPEWLPLNGAAELIARQCGVSEEDARAALNQAISNSNVQAQAMVPLNASRDPRIWRRAVQRRAPINPSSWDPSRVDWDSNEGFRCTQIEVRRSDIAKLLTDCGEQSASAAALTTDPAIAAGTLPSSEHTPETPYSTGTAGRPTSWHLIERECRCRHAAGERHPTTAEWARVLADWLSVNHPDAPSPTDKTLRNKLAGLLRELQAQNPPGA